MTKQVNRWSLARLWRLFQPRPRPASIVGEADQTIPYPLNAPGDFYVLNECCIACEAPEREAPDLLAHHSDEKGSYHCYFRRQPNSPEELELAIYAITVACCGALRYGGTDPYVLRRLAERGDRGACDNPLPEDDPKLPA